MREFKIKDEYIKLGQLLKACGIAGTGLDAKEMILAGEVRVNGEKEERRGRKLYPGDVVFAENEEITVK